MTNYESFPPDTKRRYRGKLHRYPERKASSSVTGLSFFSSDFFRVSMFIYTTDVGFSGRPKTSSLPAWSC